jgi:hypothetical protein
MGPENMEAGDYDYTYSTVDYQYIHKSKFHYWSHQLSLTVPVLQASSNSELITQNIDFTNPNRSVTGVANKD